ncbi:MAG TPA: hypothetical protein VJN96_13235 [Vicinamibacterales bacterium]|nr:hypothetical protein [Vicinamibacterales bacterium]
MQLFAGDVLICRQVRQSKCAYGIVRKSNAMPTEWMAGSLQAARRWALIHTLETGGMRREFAEVARPAARRPGRSARR